MAKKKPGKNGKENREEGNPALPNNVIEQFINDIYTYDPTTGGTGYVLSEELGDNCLITLIHAIGKDDFGQERLSIKWGSNDYGNNPHHKGIAELARIQMNGDFGNNNVLGTRIFKAWLGGKKRSSSGPSYYVVVVSVPKEFRNELPDIQAKLNSIVINEDLGVAELTEFDRRLILSF